MCERMCHVQEQEGTMCCWKIELYFWRVNPKKQITKT